MERSPKGDGAGGEGAGSDINSDSDLDSSASSSDGEMDPNTQFAQYPVRSLSPNSFALSLSLGFELWFWFDIQETNMMNQMLSKRYKEAPSTPEGLSAAVSTPMHTQQAQSQASLDDTVMGTGTLSGKEEEKDSRDVDQLPKDDQEEGFKLNLAFPPPKKSKTPAPFHSSNLEVDQVEGKKRKRGDGLEGMISKRLSDRKEGGSSFVVPRPSWRYRDLGGIESCLADIRQLVEYPLLHPEVFARIGTEPVRGILLHGPPGCGKTMLANAIAGELDVPFLNISAPEIVSGMSGESEARLRDLFAEARKVAPCLVFIDEIDAIMPKRESAQREMEKRIVAQFLTCLDSISFFLFSFFSPFFCVLYFFRLL